MEIKAHLASHAAVGIHPREAQAVCPRGMLRVKAGGRCGSGLEGKVLEGYHVPFGGR